MLTFYRDTFSVSLLIVSMYKISPSWIIMNFYSFILLGTRKCDEERPRDKEEKCSRSRSTGGSSRIPLRQENSCKGARCPTGLFAREREYSSIKYS